jgi:hypothetical protein
VLAKAFAPAGAPGGYPGSIEPIYAGLGVSLLIYAGGWLARRARRPALEEHVPVPER